METKKGDSSGQVRAQCEAMFEVIDEAWSKFNSAINAIYNVPEGEDWSSSLDEAEACIDEVSQPCVDLSHLAAELPDAMLAELDIVASKRGG